MKCDIYFNLHKHLLSIRSRERETYGIVVGHKNHAMLRNVSFVVNKAGRERVLREKKKNVHAYCRGELIKSPPASGPFDFCLVTYNPYKYKSFVNVETEEPVDSADFVFITKKEIVALFSNPNGKKVVKFAKPNPEFKTLIKSPWEEFKLEAII
jgi:hypothetical protein